MIFLIIYFIFNIVILGKRMAWMWQTPGEYTWDLTLTVTLNSSSAVPDPVTQVSTVSSPKTQQAAVNALPTWESKVSGFTLIAVQYIFLCKQSFNHQHWSGLLNCDVSFSVQLSPSLPLPLRAQRLWRREPCGPREQSEDMKNWNPWVSPAVAPHISLSPYPRSLNWTRETSFIWTAP